MKSFCFTIDDNVRFFKEITESGADSIFAHPYLHMLQRLHEKFALKIQLNLFYRLGEFTLSDFSDRYKSEWENASDWLKLSFHSDKENVCPYESSDYDELFCDCKRVNGEILRFAGKDSLAKTTTVHYCQTTREGAAALFDNGICGLLGLFGSADNKKTSYSLPESATAPIRKGEIVSYEKISYAAIDAVINTLPRAEIIPALAPKLNQNSIRVMIHEQYFYKDYKAYQPDFEDKLVTTFEFLVANGYKSFFFEDMI